TFSRASPLRDNDTLDCLAKRSERAESSNSWTITIDTIISNNYRLVATNPNRPKLVVDEGKSLELAQSLVNLEEETKNESEIVLKTLVERIEINDIRTVSIGTFLKRVGRRIEADDEKRYKQITGKLHSKGVILRREAIGSEKIGRAHV